MVGLQAGSFYSVIIQAGKPPSGGFKGEKQFNFKLESKIDYVVAREGNIYTSNSLSALQTNVYLMTLYIANAYFGTHGATL